MIRRILVGILCMSALLWAAPADSPIANAAMQGDINTVRSLLKQGADVNAPQGDGMTALHWAAYKDDAEMAKMLIYASASVSAATRINAMTPLFIAAQNGNTAIIDALLKAGANADPTLTTGATPLMFAARSGNAEAVKLLIDKGANVNAKETALGETPLMFAAASNRAAAIKVLMEHGADASIATKVVDVAAKMAASGRGRNRGQQYQTPPAPGQAPAQAPPQAPAGQPAQAQGRGGGGGNGNMDEERPPRIDTMGGLTPMLFAARQGHIEAAKALIDAGAKINEVSPGDKTSPLLMATINGHYDLAKVLLDNGADPAIANTSGGTPLYTTLSIKWAPKTDYPQPETKQERTNYLDLMKVLLDKGADPNAQLKKELWFSNFNFDLSRITSDGATTFWRAAQVGDVAAMKLLVARGADPNIKSTEGIAPLHVAAGAGVHGNDEITAPPGWMGGVKYLVEELHANVNELDKDGMTAVHHAASRGDNEMILFLVGHGAKVDIVGKKGETTVDMANGPRQRIQPFPKTIELLVGLGAKNNNKCVSC